jgi:hypothetical protein
MPQANSPHRRSRLRTPPCPSMFASLAVSAAPRAAPLMPDQTAYRLSFV